MIEYIKGILISKKPAEVIIESGGIGYSIYITLPAFESLGKTGETAKIVTHMYIKESPFAVVLYGFADENEREVFRQIISISGIGPRTAMNILSAINYRELTEMIAKGNYLPITSISGVGKKTAERLALELKDKLSKSQSEFTVGSVNEGKFAELNKISEVISALMALGYNRMEADKMVKAIATAESFMEMPVEQIIKEALRTK